MDTQTLIYSLAGSVLVGYLGYHFLYLLLRVRWKADRTSQRSEILEAAKEQVTNLRRSEKLRIDEDLQGREEEMRTTHRAKGFVLAFVCVLALRTDTQPLVSRLLCLASPRPGPAQQRIGRSAERPEVVL